MNESSEHAVHRAPAAAARARRRPSRTAEAAGTLATLARARRGATAIEYALILVAVLVMVASAYKAIGGRITVVTRVTTWVLGGQDASLASGPGGPAGPSDGVRPSAGGDEGAVASVFTSGTDGWVCDGRSCRPGSGQCFVAGTLVATPDGMRAIESIVPGDRVLSRDEETGEPSTRAVLRTFVRPARDLVDVRMARGGEDAAVVRSTAGHPYWTLAAGWTRADALGPGDVLLDPRGAEIRVASVTPRAGEEVVYNLEVEGTHTYFAGPDGAWVHNVNPNLASLPAPNLPADPATWTPQQAESLASYLHDRFYGSSNQSHQGTTVAVGVYQAQGGQVSVVVNVSGDSWGGAGLTQEQVLQLDQGRRMPLGNQPPPAMRAYLEQHGWLFTRENFHAETGLATYANMHGVHGVVAGVSRPYCTTGVCEGLMNQTFGPGRVGVRPTLPTSAQINDEANAAAAAAANGGGGAGPSGSGAGPSGSGAGPSGGAAAGGACN